MRIPSGVIDQYIYFVAVDATDLKTRETGLSSFTVYRSRNGGASVAKTTPTINETDATNMPGVYELLLDEDMTIDAGDDSQEMVFHITHAGMAPVTRTIELYRPKITAGRTLSVEADGDLTKVNTLDGHTPQTGDSFARLGAPAGASVSADITGLNDPTAAAIANAVWDELQSGHTTAGSFGEIATEIAAVLADTGSDGVALSAATQNAIADALLDRANGIEASWTLRQALRIMLAAAAGKLSGAATTSVAIRDVGDTKNRISATVDADGNRSAVTLDNA